MDTDDQDYKLPRVNPQGSDDIDDVTASDAVDDQSQGVVSPGGTIAPTNGSTTDDSPLSAEDLDLIEKAWVEKAKSIVKNTHGDPHAQNELMSKMKADYMKKRYNRDIKVSE